MGLLLSVILILLMILLIQCKLNQDSESDSKNNPESENFQDTVFEIATNLKGNYTLKPILSAGMNSRSGNWVTMLRVLPEKARNPDYLDFIITYANGREKMVRTNANVGNVWTYYNDLQNVQYIGNPRLIQYELYANTGLFRALTVITETVPVPNGEPKSAEVSKLQVVPYLITGRI